MQMVGVEVEEPRRSSKWSLTTMWWWDLADGDGNTKFDKLAAESARGRMGIVREGCVRGPCTRTWRVAHQRQRNQWHRGARLFWPELAKMVQIRGLPCSAGHRKAAVSGGLARPRATPYSRAWLSWQKTTVARMSRVRRRFSLSDR